jgi:Uma2 family endonuclease
MIADREHEMAVTAPPALAAPGEGPRRWKWTGDDLIRLGALGVLPADRKFELLDGEIIESMPPGPRHAALVGYLSTVLMRLAWNEAVHSRIDNPVRLKPHFDPQPDIAVVRGHALDFVESFPSAGDLCLLVELSDTSLAYDRGAKLQAYAAAGIADYWIVNLQADQVEVYREPDADCYRSIRVYKPGEKVTPLEAPDAEVPVNVLLGRE